MTTFHSMPTTPEVPAAVNALQEQGFIEVNPLFNVAIENHDQHKRYDLIDPETNTRLLWTPPTDVTSQELVDELIDNEGRKVFFPVFDSNEEGTLYELPLNIRLLANTLETSPYIPEYMKRLQKRAGEFLGKIALIDRQSFGLDIEDVLINHNGNDEDDVIFSLAPPLESISDQAYYDNPEAFRKRKIREIKEYIRSIHDGPQ